MIEEIEIQGFDHKLHNTKLNYPQCNCNKCPKMFFNLLSIASRQSGKTYNIVKLLKHYEENNMMDNEGKKHPLRVILISPTSEANPIYKSLRSLDENDIFESYTDELMDGIINDIKAKRQETDNFKEYEKAFYLLEKTSENELSNLYDKHPEIFKLLESYDYAHPKEITQPKYYEYPVNMVILDDMMATGAFSNRQASKLTNAIIKNRHLGICFSILVQSLKSVPKNIRLNCSVFFLGKFANKKMILDDLYEEVSNIIKPEEFDELYSHATEEKYGSLIIDCTGDGKRFLKNWEKELRMN
jgi:hypothetical protein